jgi:cytochrome c oxidase subunit 2
MGQPEPGGGGKHSCLGYPMQAEKIAALTRWMFAGAAVIWIVVTALALYCAYARPESFTRRRAWILIAGGGAIVPAIVLGVLLVYGLSMLPELLAPAPAGSLTISVDGEMWWWRVRYHAPEGRTITTANELHLPVGEPVEFKLSSDNVIHSFWIPALGGKMDMIPGRRTRMSLTPLKTGVFPGVCAEYCGASHTRMTFRVVVEERSAFDRWLAGQERPADPPADPHVRRGQESFLANGCAACHTVRGTPAAGTIGPDLTHVGGRLQAGTDLRLWITAPERLKPGSHMPRFSMLPAADVDALVAYLGSLK